MMPEFQAVHIAILSVECQKETGLEELSVPLPVDHQAFCGRLEKGEAGPTKLTEI